MWNQAGVLANKCWWKSPLLSTWINCSELSFCRSAFLDCKEIIYFQVWCCFSVHQFQHPFVIRVQWQRSKRLRKPTCSGEEKTTPATFNIPINQRKLITVSAGKTSLAKPLHVEGTIYQLQGRFFPHRWELIKTSVIVGQIPPVKCHFTGNFWWLLFPILSKILWRRIEQLLQRKKEYRTSFSTSFWTGHRGLILSWCCWYCNGRVGKSKRAERKREGKVETCLGDVNAVHRHKRLLHAKLQEGRTMVRK